MTPPDRTNLVQESVVSAGMVVGGTGDWAVVPIVPVEGPLVVGEVEALEIGGSSVPCWLVAGGFWVTCDVADVTLVCVGVAAVIVSAVEVTGIAVVVGNVGVTTTLSFEADPSLVPP